MSFECEFCNKIFKSKYNLKTHQNSAKFCLNLRNTESDEWKCDYCSKTFTTKHNLGIHYQICKKKIDYDYLSILKEEKENIIKIYEEKLEEKENLIKITKNHIVEKENVNKILQNQLTEKEKIINNKDELINKLQDQIKELAQIAIEKSSYNFNTINQDQRQNNNNNNSIKNIDNRTINMIPFNLNPETLHKTLEDKFSEAHLMKGQKGVAEFMLENVLITGEKEDKKYLLKCTDPSRKVFISVDEKGNIIKDVNADNLTKMISGPVKEVSHKLFQQIQDRYFQIYENTSNELEEDDEESKTLSLENERLDYATNRVVEISKLKNNNVEFVKGLIPPLSI